MKKKAKRKAWWKQKTTWVGIGVILAQISGLLQGSIPLEVGAGTICTVIIGLISLIISEKEGE